jgi:hypothetical protein
MRFFKSPAFMQETFFQSRDPKISTDDRWAVFVIFERCPTNQIFQCKTTSSFIGCVTHCKSTLSLGSVNARINVSDRLVLA